MSSPRLSRLIAAAALVDAAQTEIARQRGVLARAHNRPKTGVLVPRFDTDAEHDAFVEGWEEADARLA